MTGKPGQNPTTALITKAIEKSREDPVQMEKAIVGAGKVTRYLGALVRREYKDIPWRSIILGIVSLLYLINPIDFIPDAILVIGWIDDATLIGLWIASMRRDLNAFVEWEQEAVDALPAASEQIIDVEVEEVIEAKV